MKKSVILPTGTLASVLVHGDDCGCGCCDDDCDCDACADDGERGVPASPFGDFFALARDGSQEGGLDFEAALSDEYDQN